LIAVRRFCAVLLAALVTTAAGAQVERQGDSIVFRGRIDDGSVKAFLRLLREAPVRRLVITSGGGLVDPALDMAEAVRDAGLDIEVPASCMSSCANYVFPAARHKRLGRPDAVGWHGNMAHILYLARTGQGAWSAAELADAERLARREQAFYAGLGVDGFVCWFGKIPPHDVPDFYALRPADLERFGIREVEVAATVPPPLPRPDVQMLDLR